MTRILEPDQLVSVCAASFGVAPTNDVTAILKPALRRAAYLLAPCSANSLIRFVAEPLGADDTLRADIETALEELIAYGDVLEMRRIDGDTWDVPEVVLRPAPPAFVARSKHDAFILGIAGDLPTPLPGELAAQTAQSGPVRLLHCPADDELSEHLRALGLTEISEQAWLRHPAPTSAAQHVDEWRARLASEPLGAGAIDGLELLDSTRPSRFYRGRWRDPRASDDGLFVARRPQVYGGKLWSVVAIQSGRGTRLLDIRASDGFTRACDLAWRLQAAIDEGRGSPQQFDITDDGSVTHLHFHGPLPSFAERRLALCGSKSAVPHCLFRFTIPTATQQDEIAFLLSTLWMQPTHKGAQR